MLAQLAVLFSSYVVSLHAGPQWASGTANQTIALNPNVIKTYTADHSASAIGEIELFMGIPFSLPNHITSQVGLTFATTTSTLISGNIWDDADAQFNNYTYHYRVKHSHAALQGILLKEFNQFQPWISASIGIGANNAYAFNNTPLIYQALPNPNFTSHQTTSLTYSLGIGTQLSITKHIQIGIGYEWTDWGNIQLSTAPGQTTQSTLSMSHFYTNGLLGNVTYLS